MIRSSVVTRISPEATRKILNFNSTPRRRAAAEALVVRGAQEVVRIAEELARAELKDRPKDRRRHPGAPQYVDSFRVTSATLDSSGRVRAGFANDHPAANIIERGADPHPITAKAGGENSGNLVFPWDPPHSHSQAGGPPGDWPVDFEEGTRVSIFAVNHPGQVGFHFMRRAREMFRAQSRGRR